MVNSWERAVPLPFHLCCFYFSAVLIVGVPFPFGVQGRLWHSIVPVPDICPCICLTLTYQYYAYEINGTGFKLI